MANARHDAQRRTQEGRAHFRDEFLAGVILAAKGVPDLTPQAAGMTRRMGLMPISA